jgi:hypothetical protein
VIDRPTFSLDLVALYPLPSPVHVRARVQNLGEQLLVKAIACESRLRLECYVDKERMMEFERSVDSEIGG